MDRSPASTCLSPGIASVTGHARQDRNPAAAFRVPSVTEHLSRRLQRGHRTLHTRCPWAANRVWKNLQAPVAQLDRALPSEGKGHKFESCRARHHSGTNVRTPSPATYVASIQFNGAEAASSSAEQRTRYQEDRAYLATAEWSRRTGSCSNRERQLAKADRSLHWPKAIHRSDPSLPSILLAKS
jgi:hypothetical protein